jgi:hypothetical protein
VNKNNIIKMSEFNVLRTNYPARRQLAELIQAEILCLEAKEHENPQMLPREHRDHIVGVFETAIRNAEASGFPLSPPEELLPFMQRAREMVRDIETNIEREGRLAVLTAFILEMIATQVSGTEGECARSFLRVHDMLSLLLGPPLNQEEAKAQNSWRFLSKVPLRLPKPKRNRFLTANTFVTSAKWKPPPPAR